MKPEESLDVTRESDGLSPTADEADISGGVAAPENKRRRLVRSAAALAPLVLTLRSGGVAAASCTGARLVRVGDDGKFSDAYHQTNDVCIVDTPAPVCENHPTTDGFTKVRTEPASFAPVVEDGQGYRCNTNIDLNNKIVAILSSTSATSLLT